MFNATPVTLGSQQRETTERPKQAKITKTTHRLGGFDEEASKKVALALIKKSEDPYLRTEIIKAIRQFRTPEGEELLLKATQDSDEKIRKLAVDGLSLNSGGKPGKIGIIETGKEENTKEQYFDIFKKSLKDPSVQVRASSVAALGRSEDDRVVDLLIEATLDSDDTVKTNAITALGQFRNEKILDSLLPFFQSNTLDLRRSAIDAFMSVVKKTYKEMVYVYKINGVRYVDKNTLMVGKVNYVSIRMVHPMAVGKLKDIMGLEALKESLNDPYESVRRYAINSLGKYSDPELLDLYLKALKDPKIVVRTAAITQISEKADERAFETMILLLNDSDAFISCNAVKALGVIGDKRAVDPLIKELKDALDKEEAARNIYFITNTVEALGQLKDKRAVHVLLRAFAERKLQQSVIKAFGLIKDKQTVAVLVKYVSDKEVKGRSDAIKALGEIGDPSIIGILEPLLQDKQLSEKRILTEAIAKIQKDKASEILLRNLLCYDEKTDHAIIFSLGNLKKK
ncbi:MAG: HEAT repeat domain-containing protein [Proteobacteria bacterium]|nr:HEAT repeat domain-containing protein [Pseudomonadota bacterium]